MKVIALKTFRNRTLGLVKARSETDIDAALAKELQRAGLVSPMGGAKGAPEKAAVPSAPETKRDKKEAPSSAGGQDLTSSVLPPARASRQTTVTTSRRGRRKADT